jgi:hypothetical protein
VRRIKMLAALLLACVACANAAPGAFAAAADVRATSTVRPPGSRLSPRAAVALASATTVVREQRKKGPLRLRVRYDAGRIWLVQYQRAGEGVVDVQIDDRTKTIDHVYTGLQVKTPLARGEHGPIARRLHLFLAIAGVLFVLPFVDPRRPLRVLHLDLAVMLALGIHHFLFARGHLDAAMTVVYPVLLYLLVRVLWVAFRPPQRLERLVPLASTRVLGAALIAVVAARVAVCVAGGFGVTEGGYDSLWGADTITNGYELYARSAFPLNVYGPVMYLAYIPFEAIFPLHNLARDSLPGAHAAAMTFDLITIAGLIVLGRRMRPGRAGTLLGLAFAYAWSTYPWTLAVLAASTNDGLVPALVVWALVFAARLPVRAALLGLATAAKLFPLGFLPAFARGPGDAWSLRRIALYAAVVVAVVVVAVVPYLPHPGGIGQFLDLTVRSETGRRSLLSLWGLHPSLHWLQTLIRVLTVGLGIALFFVPRERSVTTLAAAAAAMTLAEELTLGHWYYLYASWFAAFVVIALFSRMTTGDDDPYPGRRSIWTSTSQTNRRTSSGSHAISPSRR